MIRTAFLEKPEELVEIALKRAKKRAAAAKKRSRKPELKAVYFSNYLMERLEKAAARVPSEAVLGPFAYELLLTMESERSLKQMRSHFLTAKKLLARRKGSALRGIRREREGSLKELVGRSSSVMKSMKETFAKFNSLQKKLRVLPQVDGNAKTVILAGYPNVGKTTILKRLTGSNAEIASYPFTTRRLNLGYFEWKYMKVQVVDTPGLLDRKPAKRNQVEKRALVALSHLADLVGFVVDCSGQAAGFGEQVRLFESVKKEFAGKKFVVFLNKADIAEDRQLEEARGRFPGSEIIEFPPEKGAELREFIGKRLY